MEWGSCLGAPNGSLRHFSKLNKTIHVHKGFFCTFLHLKSICYKCSVPALIMLMGDDRSVISSFFFFFLICQEDITSSFPTKAALPSSRHGGIQTPLIFFFWSPCLRLKLHVDLPFLTSFLSCPPSFRFHFFFSFSSSFSLSFTFSFLFSFFFFSAPLLKPGGLGP